MGSEIFDRFRDEDCECEQSLGGLVIRFFFQ